MRRFVTIILFSDLDKDIVLDYCDVICMFGILSLGGFRNGQHLTRFLEASSEANSVQLIKKFKSMEPINFFCVHRSPPQVTAICYISLKCILIMASHGSRGLK